MKITVFTRPGCHLCEEAMGELRDHLESRPGSAYDFELTEINIDTDDELQKRYLERIPVIRIGDEDISDIFFEPEVFDAALSRHSQAAG